MFDLICGTSTGGIIALGCGKTIAEIEKMYWDFGVEVFKYPWGTGRVIRSVFGAGWYDHQRLEKLLQKNFGTDMRMYQIPSKIFVVAAEASSKKLSPYLFRSYGPGLGVRNKFGYTTASNLLRVADGSSDALVWEAARASSAAPGYFDSFRMGKWSLLMEG